MGVKLAVHFHLNALNLYHVCEALFLSTHPHSGSTRFKQSICLIAQLVLQITMSATHLTQLSSQSLTFSFQDALSTYKEGLWTRFRPSDPYEGGPVVLYSAGCNVNNSRNCTAACQDSASIFANPYTIQNCMVLASLGQIQSNANDSLTLQNSVTTANNFSIDLTDPDFARLADNVNRTISECLQQYCGHVSGCYPGFQSCEFSASSGDPGFDPSGYCYTDICNAYGQNTLNPDIAGIGVRRSYLHPNSRALAKPILGVHILLDANRYCQYPHYPTEDV